MSNKDQFKHLTIAEANAVEDSGKAPVVVNLPGGATRIQFGRPEDSIDPHLATNETMRSGVEDGGSYRANAAGEVEKFGAVTRYQSEPPKFNGDPLATATTPFGSAASSINRETLLTFSDGAAPIPVKVALTLGWLREDGPGRYVVTGRHAAEIAELQGQR